MVASGKHMYIFAVRFFYATEEHEKNKEYDRVD